MANTIVTTQFPPEMIEMVRRVSKLADIYWDEDCFPKQFNRAETSWLDALIQFVADYSFERQGAPAIYRTYAREALRTIGAGFVTPNVQLVPMAWKEFERLAIARNHGRNPTVNALFPKAKSAKVTATEFVLMLGSYGYNILHWATDLLSKGMAHDAVRELRGIRGIEKKIATFYLRDVVRYAVLEERTVGRGRYLQPIDVWVSRAATIWGAAVKRDVADYWSAADLIVDLAAAAGVAGGDLNGGIWILGSQLVDRNSDPDLSDTLSSVAALETCLSKNARWCRAIVAGIEATRSPGAR